MDKDETLTPKQKIFLVGLTAVLGAFFFGISNHIKETIPVGEEVEETPEHLLEKAIAQERYEDAAKLRDQIRGLNETNK